MQSSEAIAVARLSRGPRFKFTFGAQTKVKAKRPKVERTAEVKEYYRQYMRERRARKAAEVSHVEARTDP
jgi:hypothetical protein